eukprot:3147732-Amphidinium_carterae.1
MNKIARHNRHCQPRSYLQWILGPPPSPLGQTDCDGKVQGMPTQTYESNASKDKSGSNLGEAQL